MKIKMTVKKILCFGVLGMIFVFSPALAEETTLTGTTLDIGKLTCKELMRGNDSDRDVGIAFYHGFLAGKTNSQVINIHDTGAKTERVTDYCLSNPTSTVMDAFTKSAK
jgi:hypothetical protein